MQRKIPTIIGLILTILLVIGVAVTTNQIQKVTRLFSKAEESLTPNNVTVGNITDVGFAVSWMTSQPTKGAIFYGKSESLGDGTASDDRDLSSPDGKYPTHFVRVTGLLPETKYYFKISSGTSSFGDPYSVTTGKKIEATPADPIFGKAFDASGNPASGAIAVWEAPGQTKIIALVKSDGGFVLPIPKDAESETITITGETGEKSVISCQTGLDRPLPSAKLGTDADCKKPSTTNTSAGFKVASPSGTLSTNITEGETVSTPLPTISGSAGPNKVIRIEVHSETVFSATVMADPAGNWSWTPPASLAPGQHTVTLTIQNSDGTIQTITRTFYVAAGDTILPVTSGTPSANLTHKACANYACTAVSGAGPDLCSTNTECGATPAATPATSTPPVTGQTENTLILLTIGTILGTLGLILFRWTTR